jgi:tagatose 6-phosphate kinase
MATPIVTVTPNPAWDVTYEVPALTPGQVHRVGRVHRRLGGKGVNAARVLAALGYNAVAVIPGPDRLASGLGDHELDVHVVPGLPALRQTVVVQCADGTTTSLWEPGPAAAPGAEEALIAGVTELLDHGAGLVVAGSMPPGLDPGLPARLAIAALRLGVPVIVDTSGPALAGAAEVPGVVLAPNTAELAELTGRPCGDPADAIAAARVLLSGRATAGGEPRGPLAVVVTLGPAGLAAVTRDGTWHGRLPEPLTGNPTGAGDAAAAALIAGLAAGAIWPQIVRDAVAASAAAVLSPVAGDVSPADCIHLRRQAEVREVK